MLMSCTIGSVLINHPNAPPMIQANEIFVLKEIEVFSKPIHSVTEQMSVEKYVTSSKAICIIIKCLITVLDTITPTIDLAKQSMNSINANYVCHRLCHVKN